MTLRLDRTAGRLWRGDGRCFEPRTRAWEEAAGGPRGEPVSVLDAVTWLQCDSGERCCVPVGVIGARAAGAARLESPNVTLYTRGFSHFVTSMTAPIASGRSDSCRVGLAPTEERRLSTAHTQLRHSSDCVIRQIGTEN